jgi:hypothetical protein
VKAPRGRHSRFAAWLSLWRTQVFSRQSVLFLHQLFSFSLAKPVPFRAV